MNGQKELSLREAIKLNRRSFDGDQNPNWRGGNKTSCLFCQSEFEDVHYDGKKFCNKKCYGQWKSQLKRTYFECIQCKGIFVDPHPRKGRIRKYCSVGCMGNDSMRYKEIQEKRKGWKMTEEARQMISKKASARINTYSRGRNGWHDSPKMGRIFYRSSYEQKAYLLLDNDPNVIVYQPEPFVLIYKNGEGMERRYRPDILVQLRDGSLILIEIKAKWEVKKDLVKLKAKAARKWCRKNGAKFMFWTEKELGLAGRYIDEAAQGAVLAKE